MNTDELLVQVAKAGFSIDETRLLHWSTRKIIPAPVKERAGRSWPKEASWQSVAAAYLFDAMGFAEYEVQIGRFYMEEPLMSGAGPVKKLDWFFSGPDGISGNEDNYLSSFAWAVAAVKAQGNWPLHAPAEITVNRSGGGSLYMVKAKDFHPEWTEESRNLSGMGKIEYKLEQSLKDVIREDGLGSVHPREFKKPMGAYLEE